MIVADVETVKVFVTNVGMNKNMTKKSVKITKIQKKYKDKATGECRTIEINYAKVADRIVEFRQDCPRGLIETSPEYKEGMIIFKARILKDKKDQSSAEATGHSVGKNDGSEKNFEKLETLAVGRALAMLGYMAGGEVASSEEMEEFLEYQEQKKQEEILEATEKLNAVSSKEELAKVWSALSGELKIELKSVKDDLKKRYENS